MEFDYLHNTLPERGIATNRARLAEALMPVDVAAKRIVKKLEDAEALHKSVIVVHSDNGGDTCHAIGDVAPWGSNWPLRGRKMSYFEGGVRVPAFVYAPSLIPKWRVGGTYNGLMHHVDWVATFVRLAGGNAAALREEGYASLDHWDAIAAGPKYNRTVRDELVLDLPQNASFDFLTGGGGGKAAANLADWHGVVALRVGNFKLLYTTGNETWFPSEMRSDTCPYYAFSDTCATNLQELSTACEWQNFIFDVANDPYERNNLFHSDEHAGLRASLEARAATLLAEYSGAFDKNVAFGTPPRVAPTRDPRAAAGLRDHGLQQQGALQDLHGQEGPQDARARWRLGAHDRREGRGAPLHQRDQRLVHAEGRPTRGRTHPGRPARRPRGQEARDQGSHGPAD